MSEHTTKIYDSELKEISGKIMELGNLTTNNLSYSIQVLLYRDAKLARSLIDSDKTIDKLQREIEEKAILTIAKRQPVADDLRFIISTIRTSIDLERIGDLSKNIAKRSIAADGKLSSIRFITGMNYMAELALDRLERVVKAFELRDELASVEIWKSDDEIDNLFDSLFRELLTYMMEDPRNISFCSHMLFSAKNIERIGDHCTNIAEHVKYMVSGESFSFDRNKSNDAYEPIDE